MTDPTREKWMMLTGGKPAFNVESNYTPRFELGLEHGEDVWLRGETVEGEPVFNARLFPSDGTGGAIVIDNFPKMVPAGFTRRQSLERNGYDLVDKQGEIIFGFRVDDDRICNVTVNLYHPDGSPAAHGGQGGLIVHDIALRM